jgi:hypothetical protein
MDMTGKHKGHTVSSINEFISGLKKTVRNEMKSKLDVYNYMNDVNDIQCD